MYQILSILTLAFHASAGAAQTASDSTTKTTRQSPDTVSVVRFFLSDGAPRKGEPLTAFLEIPARFLRDTATLYVRSPAQSVVRIPDTLTGCRARLDTIESVESSIDSTILVPAPADTMLSVCLRLDDAGSTVLLARVRSRGTASTGVSPSWISSVPIQVGGKSRIPAEILTLLGTLLGVGATVFGIWLTHYLALRKQRQEDAEARKRRN